MGVFLQIIGGIVIAIILLIVAVYLYFKIKFGKYLSLDKEQYQTPLIIHLNEDFSPAWLKDKKVEPVDRELIQLGFERGKSYSIPEVQDVELTAYFKAPITAVLYQHKIAGVWVDLVLEKEGELELTVSNAPLGEVVKHRPEKKLYYLTGKSATQLCEHIHSYIKGKESYVIITPDNFRKYFEETYKKDMAYRARNGGISFAEFLDHKEAFDKSISDKDTREAYIQTKEQELFQWENTAIEESSLSAEEQENIYDEDGFFIVPFSTDAEAFIRYLDEKDFVDNEDENLDITFKEETDIFKLFDKLNEGKSPELRAILVEESDYPLQLKIYKYKYI